MDTMKFYTEEEALDKVLGEKGTPARLLPAMIMRLR